MRRRMLVRSIAGVLIFPLLLPALAQAREGVMLPGPYQALSQTPATTTDTDKDSLKEGAIIGAIVLGVWCLIICGQGLDNSGQLAGAVAVNAGLGALLGSQIDAGFSRNPRVLFRWRF
jgi:hypothetical protein